MPKVDRRAPRLRNGPGATFVVQITLALIVAAVVWVLVWRSAGSRFHWLHALFIPTGVVVVTGLFILRDERRWARPTRWLAELLPQVRAGEAPIEELSKVDGGLTPVVPLIQELLREIREQKKAVAQLEHEIRQRVATRTNALERQIGSLRQQAARDPLTGLYNRRMLDTYLPKLIERCAAEKIELSVLMIDIDNFKLLNDTLGHSAGDDLLRDLGQIIRSGVRDHDAPFRIGGDEFVVVLPGCGTEAAEQLAKRLIDLVDALAKPLRLGRLPRLSIGVAALCEIPEGKAQELIRLADKRLYEIKTDRRDKHVPLARSA